MLKRIFKKILSFILNPRLLLCLGIAWIITNGWSYIMLGIGTYFGINWMIAVSGAYLTFLWLPISPEKIVTVFIAIGLMRLLFPHDEKTLGVLKRLIKSIKEKHRENKEKRAMKKRIKNGTLTKSDELTLFLDGAKTPYSDIAIWHGHTEIYRHKSGYSNDERNEETSGEELYFIYSLTKVMTAVAAMQLVEREIIALDDPVSKYLPEFAGISVKDGDTLRAPKTVLAVRHLLSMTGGFDYDRKTPEILEVLNEKGSGTATRDVISAIAKRPLHFDPGSHFKYSMCHDILACVIEEASKKTFGEYLKEKKKDVKIIAVEPKSSPVLSGGKAGSHGLQGIGAGFIPEVLNTKIIDEIVTVTEEEAYEMGRIMGESEGVLVGISSGAALSAAVKTASLSENKGKTVVVLLPDTGDRYLSTPLFKK